jgi:hypothetical protein
MRVRLMMALMSTGALITGCRANATDADAGAGDAAGMYTMVSVNGQALPVDIPSDRGVIIRVLSGAFTIRDDRTYSLENRWQEVVAGMAGAPQVEHCTGTWTRSGDLFYISQGGSGPCAGTYLVSWDGADQLEVLYNLTLAWVFER